jgi:hypothetical protein
VKDADFNRTKRHLILSYRSPIAFQAQVSVRGIGETCLTSRGVLGTCQTYKTCYPFFKGPEPITRFPNFNAWDYWVLGNSDTCSYYTDDGRQAFGVCCTNPIQSEETSTANPDEQKIPNYPFIQAWPPTIPPLPTHPPDHTGF